jgi:hypothetical protein
MLNLLIRQAKVYESLENIVHAKIILESSDKKASVSSIDLVSAKSINVIEFNSSCDVFSSSRTTTKVDFSLQVTDKFVESVIIGTGSCILMREDHALTKTVYLYNPNKKSSLVATMSFTVFYHETPAINIADKNHTNLKASSNRPLNEKELSFLLKRRLNWMSRGPYPASFDYKTESQLDREMMQVYGNLKSKKRTKSPSLAYVQKTISSLERPPQDSSPPRSRPTQMKVGYLGAAWPDITFYQREKLLYRQYLAEERRLQARREISRNARALRESVSTATANIVRDDKEFTFLLKALDKKNVEINGLRRSLKEEKLRAMSQKARHSQRNPSHQSQTDDVMYARETDASRQRRLSTLFVASSRQSKSDEPLKYPKKRSSSVSSTSRRSMNQSRPQTKADISDKLVSQSLSTYSAPVNTSRVSPTASVSKTKSYSPRGRNPLSPAHSAMSLLTKDSENSSIDTNILVKKMNDAFSIAREPSLDDEELDDALEEFKEPRDDLNLRSSASRRSNQTDDFLAFTRDIMKNISPPSTYSYRSRTSDSPHSAEDSKKVSDS